MNLLSVSEILNQSISCFYIHIDNRFIIRAANNNCTNVLPSETFEKETSLLQYFSHRYQEKLLAALWDAENKKENLQVVVAPIETDHRNVNTKWSICAVRTEDNIITGFELLGVPFDIEDDEAETTAHMSQISLFDDKSQPFFSFDLKGNITHANSAFQSLLHFTQVELANKPVLSLAAISNISTFQKNITNACKGLSLEFACSLVDKNEKKVNLHVTATPLIKDKLFIGVNAFVREKEKASAENGLNRDEKRLKLILGRLKKILNSSLDMICAVDELGKFTYASAACKEILGFKTKELIGKNFLDFVYIEDLERSIEFTENVKNGIGTTNFENRFYRKNGSVAQLIWSSRWEESDKRFYCIARDATEKKLSEANLKASEEKYRVLFYNHSVPSWIYDVETLTFLEVNDAAIEHYGYTRDEFLNLDQKSICWEDEVKRYDTYSEHEDFYQHKHKGLWKHKKKNGELCYAEISSNIIEYQNKSARLVLAMDRTEQTIAEQKLRKSNERFVFLSHATFDAIWDWDLETDEVVWNDGAVKMFGLADAEELKKIEWWYAKLHPEDRERVVTKIRHSINNNIPQWEDKYRIKAGIGYKYIHDRGSLIFDDHNKPVRMIGAMQDLTERKGHEDMLQKLNNSLEKRARELAESNGELEKFAYVASHDLQEPLRMVTSFLQLLEKRYKDKLDKKASEYIEYAVDGAERMKRLILDLLEYSRVNSSKAEVEDVDVNDIIRDLKLTYKTFLLETKGTINSTKLPVVKGNKTQILQLFQNIIGNAIKYRSDKPPVIDISFEEEKPFYKFAISDNGIGIDPRFFHKIFIIFQRLHNRDEYSGTGIGLAICKKIIDKHGGKISVASTPGQGSTFYFTLPTSK